VIARTFEPYDFYEWMIDEPNVRMDPANILLVRLGKDVELEVMDQLFQRMRFF
jgi:hypothetical protein